VKAGVFFMEVVSFSRILTEFLDFSEEKGKILAKNGDFGYNRGNKNGVLLLYCYGAESKKEESR